jgi:putative ABC transport system ATP-binding protein
MLINVHDIVKIYKMGKIDVLALRGVSFQITKGKSVAITGHSGSGKTTLMDILGCLLQPTSGRYLLEGQSISQNQLVGLRCKSLVLSSDPLTCLPRTSVLHNAELPLLYNNTPKKIERCDREKRQTGCPRASLQDLCRHR